MSSRGKYERELKNLCNDSWSEFANRPILAIKSAGSMGHGDLILLDSMSNAFIVEAKATTRKFFTTNMNQHSKDQYKKMCNLARDGWNAVYMIRWKGQPRFRGKALWKKWEVFRPLDAHIYRIGAGVSLKEFF